MPRDTETAVYMEVRMPMISVMPKPRIGPEPNTAIATPASSAVDVGVGMVPEALS